VTTRQHIRDLDVELFSTSLEGKRLDVVVSGSIAALESARLIRALRRLGAVVQPWLTEGGSQFITPMSLEWASGQACVTKFSGLKSHICDSDAVIIAPASSNTVNQLARGYSDHPWSALFVSAVGQKIPVLLLPTMHESMAHNPMHEAHIRTLSSLPHVHVLQPRREEGKHKFPEPSVLADEISHQINRYGYDQEKASTREIRRRKKRSVLITMGSNRGYIDDVRYISNYSSGQMGSHIAEELYRQGFETTVVCGSAQYQPKVSSHFISCLTVDQMDQAVQDFYKQEAGIAGGVFSASVLDFIPEKKEAGKLSSNLKNLQITLKPTQKIIACDSGGTLKIGFKLTSGVTSEDLDGIAQDYFKKYHLSALVCNDLSDVSSTSHRARFYVSPTQHRELHSKQAIAAEIAKLLTRS
jgi:phosphopantothenoylcysteine decarboxylase / phosphopantothenate---cysteine ligase